MAAKYFYFEGGLVGVFKTWRWPMRDGVIKYLPTRSVSHLRMHERLLSHGSARCHYVHNEKQVWFSVTAFPKYGALQLAQFGPEQTVELGKPTMQDSTREY